MNVDSCTTLGAMLYAVDRAAALRKRQAPAPRASADGAGEPSVRSSRSFSADGAGEAVRSASPAPAHTPMPLWHEAAPAVRERYRSVSALLTQRFRIPVIGKRFDLLPAEEFRGLVQGAGIALHDPDTALALFMDVAPTLFD